MEGDSGQNSVYKKEVLTPSPGEKRMGVRTHPHLLLTQKWPAQGGHGQADEH